MCFPSSPVLSKQLGCICPTVDQLLRGCEQSSEEQSIVFVGIAARKSDLKKKQTEESRHTQHQKKEFHTIMTLEMFKSLDTNRWHTWPGSSRLTGAIFWREQEELVLNDIFRADIAFVLDFTTKIVVNIFFFFRNLLCSYAGNPNSVIFFYRTSRNRSENCLKDIISNGWLLL